MMDWMVNVPYVNPPFRGEKQYADSHAVIHIMSTVFDRMPDWTRFDVGSTLRALKSGPDIIKTCLLRKLHLRWWHASETKMRKTLSAAGIPESVLALIRDVTANCRQCREWTKPPPDEKGKVEVPQAINDSVEADLLFYKTHIVFHVIDRASRFHNGIEVRSKTLADLLDAFHKCWVSFMTAPNKLYIDGESAIFTYEAHGELQAIGTEAVTRAPNQHYRFIERRGALLRHTMHKVESQAEREGRVLSFAILLSEAITSGNMLIATTNQHHIKLYLDASHLSFHNSTLKFRKANPKEPPQKHNATG